MHNNGASENMSIVLIVVSCITISGVKTGHKVRCQVKLDIYRESYLRQKSASM